MTLSPIEGFLNNLFMEIQEKNLQTIFNPRFAYAGKK